MLVSVIIPCYNVESFISECVDSVINQTYKEIEIICIDNNSSDNTWETLQALKIKFPQILVDKQLKPGAPATRNKGLALSRGEWIQFLDADDLLLPTKIEHQVNLLETEFNNVGFIAAESRKLNLLGSEIIYQVQENQFVAPFINKCGTTCSNLWPKSRLIEIGGWNEGIKSSQETDLMFRLILNNRNNKIIIDKSLLTIIRERETGQISQGNPIEKWNQYIKVRLNFIESLKKSHEQEYALNKEIYFDYLMLSVITLAKYDMDKACKIYNQHLKQNWSASGNFGFTKVKVFLIKWFGLKTFLKFKKN